MSVMLTRVFLAALLTSSRAIAQEPPGLRTLRFVGCKGKARKFRPKRLPAAV